MNATWTETTAVILMCFLPALAVLLFLLASVLAFFPRARPVSLIFAFLCLMIHMGFMTLIMWFEAFRQQLDTFPPGRLFHSMIPTVATMGVIGFDIYALIRQKRTDDRNVARPK